MMEKVKINKGILALIMITSIFGNWQTMLIIAVLLLLFANIEEDSKKLLVYVIAFFAGITLFGLLCDLIVQGADSLINGFTELINILNIYLNDAIQISKLRLYLFTPISSLVKIFDNIASFLIIFAKFSFVVSVLINKPRSNNPLFNMINKYMDKFMNYFNNFSVQQDSVNTQSNAMNQHIANDQPTMTSTTNTMDNANSNNNSNTI